MNDRAIAAAMNAPRRDRLPWLRTVGDFEEAAGISSVLRACVEVNGHAWAIMLESAAVIDQPGRICSDPNRECVGGTLALAHADPTGHVQTRLLHTGLGKEWDVQMPAGANCCYGYGFLGLDSIQAFDFDHDGASECAIHLTNEGPEGSHGEIAAFVTVRAVQMVDYAHAPVAFTTEVERVTPFDGLPDAIVHRHPHEACGGAGNDCDAVQGRLEFAPARADGSFGPLRAISRAQARAYTRQSNAQ